MLPMNVTMPGRQSCRAIVAAAALCAAVPGQAEELEIDGTRLAYEEAGSGAVVLFLHGAVSDHRVWNGLRDEVAGRFRFMAYDQRYFGPADWPDAGQDFSVATHAEDLIAVIDALGDEPVHLVTWSYGGLVGLHAALRHPDRFRSLVHYEPTVESLHAGLSGERAAIAQKFASFGPMAEALNRGEDGAAVRRLIEAVFRMEAGAADEFPEDVQRMWDDNARTLPPFLEALGAAAPITCAELAALEVPTLVIQGSEAHVLNAMMADEVVRCQPDASGFVLEDANHGGPVQQPEGFIDAALSFLSAID